MNDCTTTTGYTKTDDGNTSDFSVDSGDFFKLNVTVSGGNEETKVKNDDNLGLSTSTYTTIRWRYKCSNANIKAKIICTDDVAYTQTVLADSNSTDFTVGTATLTTAKTLDHVELYADHAVGIVYYDYILIYRGDFTFPNCAGGIDWYPPVNYNRLEIPGRFTTITQQSGSGDGEIRIKCDLTVGDWTRTVDTIPGEIFDEIAAHSGSDTWQWIDTERRQMKVTMERPRFHRGPTGDGWEDVVELVFHEYRISSGDNTLETYDTRFGINL